MPLTVRPSGISVNTRGGATVEGSVKLRRRRTGELPVRDTTPASVSGKRVRRSTVSATPLTEEEALINAIEDQDLDLVDAVPLGSAPVAPAASSRRRRTSNTGAPAVPAGEAAVDLDVPLTTGESAVVLVEQNGVYEWHTVGEAVAPPPVPPPTTKHRRRQTGASAAPTPATPAEPTHALRFSITLAPPSTTAAATVTGAARRRRSGMIKKFLINGAVAYVFKFIAKPIVAGLARFQERNIKEGLVRIDSTNPAAWATLSDTDALPLPSGRPAKVLLMVHGTFSSTIGSFGGLASHDAGLAFLKGALANYDLILGWDHKTLSASPAENAVDIITRLDRLGFKEPPTVDAVAFSRGGLVLRSLIEEILPNHKNAFRVRRAVFVACTNCGTQLASPKHWNSFVDRYTNIAAAGARIVSLVPAFTHGALIFAEGIKGVGAFVKALVSAAKKRDVVPGLEAMDPEGSYVNWINEQQPGQPDIADTYYCAITSNFDPDTAAKTIDPVVMPPGLLYRIGDKLTDALYGEPNDLVVHVASMTYIDPTVGEFIRDRHDFGTNGQVFHTNYFHQHDTALALVRWFGIPQSPAPVEAGGKTQSRRTAKVTTRGRSTDAKGALAARANVPRAAVADTPSDVLVLRSTMRAADALKKVEASASPWIVVERSARDHNGGAVAYHYAYPREQALNISRNAESNARATLHEAFNLRETASSMTVVNAPAPDASTFEMPNSAAALQNEHSSRFRAVVIDAAHRMRVVPSEADAIDGDGRVRRGSTDAGSVAAAPPAMPPQVAPPLTPGRRRVMRSTPRATPPKSAAPGHETGNAPTAAGKPVMRGPKKPATSTEVAFNVGAATDDEYVLDATHVVAVTISREAIAAATKGVQKTGAGKAKATLPLIVECLPMTRTSMVNDADGRVEVPVPAAGDPIELRFDVVAREIGAALIKVQVRQGPMPLVTMSLDVTVVAARSGARKEVVARADAPSVPALPAATNELRIVQLSPTNSSSQYRFELRLPSKRVQQEFVTTELTTDAQSYIANMYKKIEDRWTEHKSEQKAFARDLRAIGSDLFDQLMPLELRQLLWKHRDVINSVQVISSEPFIPWELVYLRDPAIKKPGEDAAFLGELGVVRWLMHDYPPEQLTISRKKARYVIPEYEPGHELPAAQEERDLVTTRFSATEVTGEAESIYELISEPGQFDLLHIACHGMADSTDIGAAQLEMPGKPRSDGSMSEENLMADTVRREADLRDEVTGSQPIVVLNACQSARAGYGLKGIGGFAEAFVAGGAGVFVGSSWSVGDVPARAFIEEFYAQFLSGKAKSATLAQAVAKARTKAREDGDATWLAYVVYGHPRAVATLVK